MKGEKKKEFTMGLSDPNTKLSVELFLNKPSQVVTGNYAICWKVNSVCWTPVEMPLEEMSVDFWCLVNLHFLQSY